jgi:hypothetical protein
MTKGAASLNYEAMFANFFPQKELSISLSNR